jgi:hypothetical protein
MIEDLVKGAVYAEYNGLLDELDEDYIMSVYRTYLIVAKSLAFSIGNYDNSTKEITLQSGAEGLPYCDVYNGCKVISHNGKYTYVSANYEGNVPGQVIKTIDAMDPDKLRLLELAYADVSYSILVPKDFDELLTKYDFGNVAYTQAIKENWIDLSTVCNIVDKNAVVHQNTSAHVHIGMQILGNNPKYWRNFAKLWMTYEYIITRFLYGEYTSPRNRFSYFAEPIYSADNACGVAVLASICNKREK